MFQPLLSFPAANGRSGDAMKYYDTYTSPKRNDAHATLNVPKNNSPGFKGVSKIPRCRFSNNSDNWAIKIGPLNQGTLNQGTLKKEAPKQGSGAFCIDLENLLHPEQNSTDGESSGDEFFDSEEVFKLHERVSSASICSLLDSGASVFDGKSLEDFDYTTKPHMTRPLVANNVKLDFSLIENQRGLTNIHSATPLARVLEFTTSTNAEEFTLLNILADEFESRLFESPKRQPSLWKNIKHFTWGASDDEFDEMYPWAKYSIKCEGEK